MFRNLALVVAMVLSTGAIAADRVMLHLMHEYGDFVDRGAIYADIRTWPFESRLDCLLAQTDVRSGNRIQLTWTDGGYDPITGSCGSQHRIGPLSAGTYEVTARVLRPDGSLFAENTQTLNVESFGGRCNPLPVPGKSVGVAAFPKAPWLVTDVLARLEADPGFAAAIGSPTTVRIASTSDDNGYVWNWVALEYPPLHNPVESLEQTAAAFPWTLYSDGAEGWCSPVPGSSAVRSNIEYLHPGLGHYFHTNDAQEIAKLDAGAAGLGWIRTGHSFNTETVPNCTDGQTAVYRFWGIPGLGLNSHFFTRDPVECAVVEKSAVWTFEQVAFWASRPNPDGTCNPLQYLGRDRIPLYRAWRPVGDSTHRFSTDRAVIDEMVTKGWVDEGAVMCVLPPD